MLLREGTSKGNEPSVMVLEVAQHQDRKADDLLPYLGAFAKFFRKLPNNPKDLILKSELVLLSDIECFTKSIIDIPQSVQNLSRKKGKYIFVNWHDLANPRSRYSQARPGSVLAFMSVVGLRGLG